MKKPKDISFPAKYYWCVHVQKKLSSDGEIYVYADKVENVEGDLIFYIEGKNKELMLVFAVSAGNWLALRQADLWTGAACSVIEHWKGVKGCEGDKD